MTKHVHKRPIMAELESHVNIFVIFKAVLESDDVGVAESTVDLDFGIELKRGRSE